MNNFQPNTSRLALSLIIILFLNPGQTDSQVDASQRKFAKPELAYGLAMGGQTDSQVDASQRKFAKPELAYGWPNGHPNRRKSTQVCKPELAYGLVMGGQTDSLVGSQIHASR